MVHQGLRCMHLKILYFVNECIYLFFSKTMSQASLRLKQAFLRAEAEAAGHALVMPSFGHVSMLIHLYEFCYARIVG